MFTHLSAEQFLLIVAAAIAAYYVLIYRLLGIRPVRVAAVATDPTVSPSLQARQAKDLVGKAKEPQAPSLDYGFEPVYQEPSTVEMLEDQDSILVKAAEKVVEHINDVVTHIASFPPNPEEVRSKIAAIIKPYSIFHGTEYFDAINAFIAQAVERECALRWAASDVVPLWG
jgi:hypothetical protein